MYGKKLEEYFSKPRNFEEIDWYEFMKFNNIHPIISIYQDIKDSGYLTDGEIVDLMKSSMTDGDRARLNGYGLDDMQYRLFIDAKLDKADYNEIISYLNELTDYKLVEKCNTRLCEITLEKIKGSKNSYVKVRNNGYSIGDKLMETIINNKKWKVRVTNEKNPQKWQFGTDRGTITSASMSSDNIDIRLDRTQDLSMEVLKRDADEIIIEKQPFFIALGHEFIHTSNVMNGSYFNNTYTGGVNPITESTVPSSLVFSYTINKNGKLRYDGKFVGKKFLNGTEEIVAYGEKEELKTVGLGTISDKKNEIFNDIRKLRGMFNNSNDITENALRNEHKLNLRSRYYLEGYQE